MSDVETLADNDHFFKGEDCPGCGHPLLLHAIEVGCTVDWDHDENGIAQSQGCECPLTLAEQYAPPHEKDLP